MKQIRMVALFCAPLPALAQVVRIGGGGSTIAGTEGAAVTLYQADATTQTSMGYAQGLHMGASRQVESGPLAMTTGDTALTLSLPTDLPGSARVLSVRGVLLQTLDQRVTNGAPPSSSGLRVGGSAFAGWTGDGYRNAFFSSVEPTHAIAFATARLAIHRNLDLSAVAMRGTHSSLLASAAWTVRPETMAACTLGVSGGKPVVQMAAHSSGQSWHAEGNYTSGALHLQPEPTLASLSLERIGWNLAGNKRVRNWLWLDGARHEFATADTVDGAASGLAAGRSVLYEVGGTVRFGAAEAGGRALRSISGPQGSGGYVLLAGWNARRWNVRGTAVRNTIGTSPATYSASIDTTERISTHLRLTQGTNFANGAPSFDFGGTYENRLGALTVSHRETFVPFGNGAGFHRVLAIGIRLHLRDTELSANQISGQGLNTSFEVAVDSFHGESLGAVAGPVSRMSSLPRYAVTGHVSTPDGTPVRGAAIAVGAQTVFTDSDGRFFARMASADAVRVAATPALFLTSESYRDLSGGRIARPQHEDSAESTDLLVDRCSGCNTNAVDGAKSIEPEADHTERKQQRALVRTGAHILRLAHRMVRITPSPGGGGS